MAFVCHSGVKTPRPSIEIRIEQKLIRIESGAKEIANNPSTYLRSTSAPCANRFWQCRDVYYSYYRGMFFTRLIGVKILLHIAVATVAVDNIICRDSRTDRSSPLPNQVYLPVPIMQEFQMRRSLSRLQVATVNSGNLTDFMLNDNPIQAS